MDIGVHAVGISVRGGTRDVRLLPKLRNDGLSCVALLDGVRTPRKLGCSIFENKFLNFKNLQIVLLYVPKFYKLEFSKVKNCTG